MEAGGAQLRPSAAIRVLLAVLVAAGLTMLAILAAWGPLDVKTDVVGYPVFNDFNVNNYFTAYYLAIGLFPLAALLLFWGLTRLGPRFGLAAPPSRGGLRTLLRAPGEQLRLADEQPLDEAPQAKRWLVTVARLGFVGAILGFELGVAANTLRAWIPIGIVAYPLLALLAAQLGRSLWPDWSLEARLAAVNSFGAVLTVAGLLVVALNTEVTVNSTGEVLHFAWFPVWLALPLIAIFAAVVTAALRRAASAARALQVERWALLLVAAPTLLVLLHQVMTGDLGEIDMFHLGEQLVGHRLVADSSLPWRDVVLTHGIFQDAVYAAGEGVFGNNVWGFLTGAGMIMNPLTLLSLYFLLVYLLGRNWLLLGFAALLVIGTILVPDEFRLILMAPILLLLATLLREPAAWKSVLLAFLVVVQVILTPEAVPIIPAIAAVLVLYEWHWREPGTSILPSFGRTAWVAAAGVLFAAAFAIYLAARGALDDYVYVSTNLLHGHALSGGVPPGPNPGTLNGAQFDVAALAPPAAILISFAYAAARLRLRRGFYIEDWVMAANVIFLLLYYPKFLARMDTGHVYQPFVAALPLILYIVLRAVGAAERRVRDWRPAAPVMRLTIHPISLAIVVVTVAMTWGALHDRVENARVFHHVTVSEPPSVKGVGYTQVFDDRAYRDIKRVIDAYLGPDDRLFDFSNSPALFFYIMGREPSMRWFHVSIANAAELQHDLIRRLETSRPKLIAFDNDSDPFPGLSNFDGMPTSVHLYDTSQWILDHYKPLLWTHGVTIYARRDQPPPSRANLNLSEPPSTHRVAFSVQPCQWGAAPNFLNNDAQPTASEQGVGARARPTPSAVTVVGWAGDPNAKVPARKVIAVVDGKVVGEEKPGLKRPDLVAFGLPQGFIRAGFQLQVPVKEGGALRLYGESQDGKLTEIVAEGGHPQKGAVPIGGREVKLTPNAVYGQVNSSTRAEAMAISKPKGSRWSDFRYLELDAPAGGFKDGTFTVYDDPTRPSPDHDIVFQTLDRSPQRYVVPVGACAQWHGYRSDRLFMNLQPGQQVSAVRLIR